MSRYSRLFFVLVAFCFVFGFASGAIYDRNEVEEAIEAEETVAPVHESMMSSPRKVEKKSLQPKPAEESPNLWQGYENVCETFTVYESRKINKKGRAPVRYRRNRFKRKFSDQKRTRALIRMVAKEMGADPDFVETLAMHESSWNPYAIHILNPDLEANRNARKRYSYSRTNERKLEEALKEASAQSSEFWKIKRRLSRIRLYKGNPYWDARLRYERVYPSREARGGYPAIPEEHVEEWASVWGFGYGLYGMNAILYTHVWDRTAPPWLLCGDEGIVATITAIWAMRDQQDECAYLTQKDPEKWGDDGGSARGVIRRFARGQCGDGRLGPAWRRLMANREGKVDWDAPADLGNEWPRFKMKRKRGRWRYVKDDHGNRIPSDRMAVLEHMRKKAEEQGLLREEPLERKKPGTAPVIALK